jgi:hypothetical protein
VCCLHSAHVSYSITRKERSMQAYLHVGSASALVTFICVLLCVAQ